VDVDRNTVGDVQGVVGALNLTVIGDSIYFCESRIYKKDRKTKEFPRIDRTFFSDVVMKTSRTKPVDIGDADVIG
jgi:hypothetical protein